VQQQQQWDTEDDHQDDDTDLNKKKKRKRRQEFDLVLGQVKADIVSVAAAAGNETTTMQLETEPIVSDPFAIIKLGKHVTCEAAAFLPLLDSLVTGSSDGLIEIWDAAQNYETLNLNLPYQKNDELLGHDNCITALAVSNDASLLASGDSTGLVKLWRVDTGTCVRTVMAHEQSAVRCLHFSPDASHLLTTAAAASRDSCAVREFGLRTARMLKEFRGHDSFVNCCSYQVMGDKLVVVTGSGDGTVRMWDGKTADVIHVLRPTTSAVAGSSLVVDATSNGVPESAAIHSILHLHTPASTMVIVPRGNQAYLVTYTGTVLRTFQDDGDPTNVYLAAAISSSNQWLYAVKENGACCVFRVATGDLTKTISDFAAESTRMPTESKTLAEISAVASHPTKSIVGAYSNNKGQKRGQMVLWK
jgi:WD40 repeat-containing protein SMU1